MSSTGRTTKFFAVAFSVLMVVSVAGAGVIGSAGVAQAQSGGADTIVPENTDSNIESPAYITDQQTVQQTNSVSFSEEDIDGISVNSPTSIEFGPDGRLYVAQQNGIIKAYTLSRESDGYTVTETETIDDVRSDIPNHNDDGSLASNVDDRQVTGIHLAGTADDPVLYVTSSDPRSGGGGGAVDTELDTNSGVVSKLTWADDGSREHTILVRGLTRSREKHSTNGLQLDESSNTLYIAQGGHTSRGAPSPEFDEAIEYALSGAILTVDLDQVEGMSGETNANGIPVKYDLPTLQETEDPFGGQGGANMAKIVDGGPVQVYSPGWRNPYDVELTEDGKLYTVDNGGASGWGGPPINEGPEGVCTHEFNDPQNVEDDNSMQYISGEGYYGGHPNPTRGNPDGAATNVQDDIDYSPAVPSANPVECDYLAPSETTGQVNPDDGERGSMYVFSASTNGLAEYTASNFDGAMQGDILAASYDGSVYRVQRTSDGTEAAAVTSIASGFGSIPLDVDSVGDNGPFPGTVWAVTYQSDGVHVFEASDYDGSDGTTCDTSDPDGDADGDGYTNADEEAAGSDPCNTASQPEDFDDDGISDVTDTDDDSDGIPDTEDPFAQDADNGLSTGLPQTLDFENQGNDPLDPGVGFTGLMTNGQDDYADLVGETEVGAAAGVLTLTWDTGSAFEETNTQKNAFQFGTTTPNEPFVVHAQINDGFSGNAPEEFHNYGVFVGDGTQGDYAKLVIGARGNNDADGEVELAIETDDGAANEQVPDSSVIGSNVDLYMAVDPTTDPTPDDGSSDYAVTFEYAVDGGERTEVGSGPYALPASWFSDQDQGAAIGLIGTATGGNVDQFDGTYELLEAHTVSDGSNVAPTIEAIDDQSVVEGDSVTVDVTASDADSDDTPSLSLTQSPDFVTLTDAGDGTGTIEIASGSGAAADSPYTVEVQASDDSGATATESFQVVVSEGETITPGTVEYRVNVGGSELSGSPAWTQDAEGSPSQYIQTTEDIGFSNYGDSVTQKSASVPDDVPLDLYETAKYLQTEPQGDGTEMNWEFPVEEGATYEVRLYFAEPYFGSDGAPAGEGQREFDVAVEDETRLENYDIYADVGFGTGTVKTFQATPSDGTLDVDLIDGAANNPIVNGVEIVKTEDAPSDANPEASVAITPNSGVDASTFSNDGFQVENTGDVEITSVSIDTETTILPDFVYDPNGTAGDGGDKSFQLGSGSDDVGVVSTADADLFDKPKNGQDSEDGYQRLTVEFTDFQSGETLLFGSDGDPTSIKGSGDAQQTEAGPVSGAELAGATVTIEFADGTTKTVRMFGDGSAGGSEVVSSADQSAQPTLDVQNVQLNSSALDARHSAATVSDATQTVTVSGPAGATVQVMQADTELNVVDVPDYDGSPGYNIEEFEGNNFVGVTYDTVTLDSNGQATLQVDVPSDNLLYVMAAVQNDDGSTGEPSSIVVLEQGQDDGETITPGTVEYRVNVGGPELSGSPVWTADGNGTDGSEPASQYLQTTPTEFSEFGGAVTDRASDVPANVPLEVYNSARFVDTGGQQTDQSIDWEFPVEEGATYEVRLYFAEPYFGGSGPEGEGQREFDVATEDQTVLTNYDIYADVGYGTGTLKTFTVTPSDGTLDVDLIDGAANNPIVNGVEVVKTKDAPGDGNTAPEIDPIGDQSAVEGDSVTVDVTTSDDDGDTASLSLTESPDFVNLTDDGDGTGTIEIAPGSGAATNSPYTVTVQADDGTDTANESFQVTVEEATASASISINPDDGVDATTYDNDAYQIENTGNIEITSISFDTETTILPDLVYDPNGTAGDGGDKSFQAGANSDTVGVVSTADADLFDKPKNDAGGDDGYQRLTLNFTDFQSGETLLFGSDGDPTSIKGADNNVQNTLAGPVSGAELSGMTVTVEFADGTTETVRTFGDGSAGGSAVVSTADQTTTAPTLGVQNVSLDANALDARHSAAYVAEAQQTLTVSGPAGATVQVMQADTELNLEGVPDYDGSPGYNIEEFEGNNFLSVSYQTVQLDSNGQATVDVTLPDQPEQPVYFMATVENDDGSTGEPSNVVVLQNDPSQVETGPGPVGNFSDAPSDPDGDGFYEDVNGDGDVNVGDAQAIFSNAQDPVIQNNVEAFDYNGDGSVNVGDAQALFANGLAAGDGDGDGTEA